MSEPDSPGRRRFLKIATCAVGGTMGAAIAVPAVRYLIDPVGRRIVTASDEPIEVLAADRLTAGAPPLRVPLVAAAQRDAWSSVENVPLGSAWLRRDEQGKVSALSSVCPHLGCAVGFDPASNGFRCPCHESAFSLDGARMAGPSERGLDPLPVVEADGRISLTWIRFRAGGSARVPL